MKHVVIIPDGAADIAIPQLDGLTPLEKASIPNIHNLAREGRCGLVSTVPHGMAPGSDVAIMSILGNNPSTCYTGRAPIEAASRGIELKTDEWAFRCNLVTIIDGVMKDHSAGNISSAEAATLMGFINESIATPDTRFYSGVSYRNLMTLRGNYEGTTTPPHDILDKPIKDYLPQGSKADTIAKLVEQSMLILPDHPVNKKRVKEGKNPATSIWFWGEGKSPTIAPFYGSYGLTGAIIAAVDLVRGLGLLMGWKAIDVPGATGFLDTNYHGKGEAAIEAIKEYDIVCVHIEAPDEAGHAGEPLEKVKALEEIDRHIVGPVSDALKDCGEKWKLLLMPDHPTPCALRTHTGEPVPFLIAGSTIKTNGCRSFTEKAAEGTGLHIMEGHTLMKYFIEA